MSIPLIETTRDALPEDVGRATLVGRVHVPEFGGPAVVALREDRLVDISETFPTMTDLSEQDDVLAAVRAVEGGASWPLSDVLENSLGQRRDAVHLLAPIDLAAVKAAGVTFAASLVERLIEERAGGDFEKAAEIRASFEETVGVDLADIAPGSEGAAELKRTMVEQGLWSQYLEVGLGPDPEIFTKAQPLSAVGFGQEIGVAEVSDWNNPEPEVVLLLSSGGRILGATLGNDVNLRDVEGRSALLLPKAKDNNASASLGPFIRLFDEHFTIDDVRIAEVDLTVLGEDGFVLDETSSMDQISRDVEFLAAYTVSDSHQYPDGLVLYTGTLFAPTKDRGAEGRGFTHTVGDVVRISSPKLGALVNRVNTSERAEPWTFGLRAFIANLRDRGLLERVGR
ncbi:fumarylacetoacetate hydrolase family protein [Leucobacter sp. wl10]|uniref:fumarylacetoacetate hydrolase family protein n=1 Tax=Leucobacter sp. wl10 TaxID=2304677 RepID=UPI000E5A5405|nr:fumarylacetoacetate hydrolase family protein [Leucobacter sp. wl10]RGE20498.1 fumarylacetoacetate hydrolase [Leucobacter sp. wl10]